MKDASGWPLKDDWSLSVGSGGMGRKGNSGQREQCEQNLEIIREEQKPKPDEGKALNAGQGAWIEFGRHSWMAPEPRMASSALSSWELILHAKGDLTLCSSPPLWADLAAYRSLFLWYSSH